jgi:hypothetical protein
MRLKDITAHILNIGGGSPGRGNGGDRGIEQAWADSLEEVTSSWIPSSYPQRRMFLDLVDKLKEFHGRSSEMCGLSNSSWSS